MNNKLLPLLMIGIFLSTNSTALAFEPTLDRIKAGNQIVDYIIDAVSLPDSVFAYNETTSSDSMFAIPTKIDGTNENIYYKIVLKPENFSNSSDLIFETTTANGIAIRLPKGKTQYFSYQYTGASEYVGKYYSDSSSDWNGGGIELFDISIDGDDDWGDDSWGDDDWWGDIEIEDDDIGGGALNVTENTDDIIADFVENRIDEKDNSEFKTIYGGAIRNAKWVMGNIKGDFVNNYLKASWTYGGAIDNCGTIQSITGNFVGNYADAVNEAWGGSISNGNKNNAHIIGDITGNFIGNYTKSGDFSLGGGIANYLGRIGDIVGDFIGNYAESDGKSLGGAIANGLEYQSEIGNITGDFIANYSKASIAKGGAIMNMYSDIGHITSDFIANYAEGSGEVAGGAIYHHKGTFGEDDEIGWGDLFSLKNSTTEYTGSIKSISGSFIDNHVKVTENGGIGLGGAIYVQDDDLTFKADGVINRFSGNYVENADGSKVNNAIFVNNSEIDTQLNLTFEIKNEGSFIFDDEIDGGFSDFSAPVIEEGYAYNINISGDVYDINNPQSNTIRFNDLVNNVYDFSLDSVQMALGKNAVINIVHNYVAQNNPYLRLDLDAVKQKVGQIDIRGEVIGTTFVVVNVLQNKETTKENSIGFAVAKNHTLSEEEAKSSFEIYRVIGSPYMWEVSYDDAQKEWSLYSTNEDNPYWEDDSKDENDNTDDGGTVNPKPVAPVEVTADVMAVTALPSAGLAQTNGMIYNIIKQTEKISDSKDVWANATYNSLKIDTPVEIDANVWGIEAGGDVQNDLHNRLGIFVSYRQGNYEMTGNGEEYFAKLGSELDINSYLAGLYYRYDNNNWYAFATLYGGIQQADIATNDGISISTDGVELGGSIEGGYKIALTDTLFVTPSLGVYYNQISYDDTTDNYGKTIEYGDLKQIELEAGVKFLRAKFTDDGFYSLYVKPSMVQTIVNGDEVNITGLDKVDTVEDQTLVRFEIGGNYGFNENWSAYGWANYTFGSSYDATSLGLGLNYAW